MRGITLACLAVLCAALSAPTSATIIHVPGDQPNIQAGINAAAEGDTVLVAPDTYSGLGNQYINFGGTDLVLLSEAGPESTIIDGLTYDSLFRFSSGETAAGVVSGFTIANGHGTFESGGMRISGDSSPTIENCVFTGCEDGSGISGGALDISGTSTSTVTDCIFTGNDDAVATTTSFPTFTRCEFSADTGAPFVMEFGSPELVDCTFTGNLNPWNPGPLRCINGGTCTVTRCTFTDNLSAWPEYGGDIVYASGDVTVVLTSCTFADNVVEDGTSADGAVITSQYGATVSLDNCIIAFNGPAKAVRCGTVGDPGTATLVCCDVYGNEGGDWVGCISGQFGVNGNISEDPLFCGEDNPDEPYAIALNSPCTAANSACGLIGARDTSCGPEPEPAIASITDVGNDQGRQVRLEWLRSGFDVAGSGTVITGYGIYRRRDEFLREGESVHAQIGDAVPGFTEGASGEPDARLAGWDYIDAVPARGDSIYLYVAPTLCDSTELDGICWSAFFVSATTPDPLVYFDSPPDSGYSIDNLAPEPPTPLRGEFDEATGFVGLSWPPSPSPDLQYYELHRGEDLDFVPNLANRIYADVDTSFVDASTQWNESTYYKVAAVDFGGNRSAYSVCSALSTGVPDGELPASFAVHAPRPNPFGPSTTIAYDVPRAARVSVRVYDASGRLVRTLLDRAVEPGRHASVWDGRDSGGRAVAAGVYFCRVETEGKGLVRRVVLLK